MRALTISPHYLLVALALALVAALAFGALPFRQAEAIDSAAFTDDDAEISANGVIDLLITGSGDPDNKTLYVLTIGEYSTGSAQFTSNDGQTLVCVNNDPCDIEGAEITDKDVSTTVRLMGTDTAGVVLVNIIQFGGGNDADSIPHNVSYRQTAPVSSIRLVAANGLADVPMADPVTRGQADSNQPVNLPLTATGDDASHQIVLSAIVKDDSGASAPINTAVRFRVVGQGLFRDTVMAANVVHSAVKGSDVDGLLIEGGLFDNATETEERRLHRWIVHAVLPRAHGDARRGRRSRHGRASGFGCRLRVVRVCRRARPLQDHGHGEHWRCRQ